MRDVQALTFGLRSKANSSWIVSIEEGVVIRISIRQQNQAQESVFCLMRVPAIRENRLNLFE